MHGTKPRDRALILANPRSRRAGAAGWRETVLAELSRRYATELTEPGDASETTRLARKAAADGVAVIIAAGGDGTVNLVAQGLAGTQAALGIIPLGSANDLAREYRLPRSPPDAAHRILVGSVRTMDLIEIGGRVFCGVGGLALVSRSALAVTRFKQRSTAARRLGDALGGQVYRVAAAVALFGPALDDVIRVHYRDPSTGECRQVETVASAVFVTNHRTVGGGLVVPVAADPCDGVLEVCLVPARTRVSLMLNFSRLSVGARIPEGVLVPLRATGATIETTREDAFVADGELLTEGRRFTVRVLPGALRIVV
jgi:diacylglycerol kinase (ATP)